MVFIAQFARIVSERVESAMSRINDKLAKVRAAAGVLGLVGNDEKKDDGEKIKWTGHLDTEATPSISDEELARADRPVRLPIYGRAESLNLATAASVCLYESAFAQRS